jgi:hypothetical protein
VRRPMRAGQMNAHFTNISWCSLNPGLAGRSRASRTRPSSGLADCLLGKKRSLIVQQICLATPFSASAGRQSATARGEANQRLAFRTRSVGGKGGVQGLSRCIRRAQSGRFVRLTEVVAVP